MLKSPISAHCRLLISHTEGTNLQRVTDRRWRRSQASRERTGPGHTATHSDSVVPVALGLRDAYPPGFDRRGPQPGEREREHLIGRGTCHSSSDSKALMQWGNCSVYMKAARRAKSASHWLEGNVDHQQCQIRHHSFLNDVTAALWQSSFSASGVCGCLRVYVCVCFNLRALVLLHPERCTSCSWVASDSSSGYCQRMCFLASARTSDCPAHTCTHISLSLNHIHIDAHTLTSSSCPCLLTFAFICFGRRTRVVWYVIHTHTQRKGNPPSETHLFSVIAHL